MDRRRWRRDLRIGLARGRMRRGPVARALSVPAGLLPLAAAAWLLCFGLLGPVVLNNPTLRATLDTAATLCALAAAWLMASRFAERRRARDLLMLAGVLTLVGTQFAFSVLPTAMALPDSAFATTALLLGQGFAGGALATAALTSRGALAGSLGDHPWRPLAAAIGGSGAAVALAGLGGLSAGGLLAKAHAPQHDLAGWHPAMLAVVLGASLLPALAAAGLGRSASNTGGDCVALPMAGASILLAGGYLYYLALPAVVPGWIVQVDGMRYVGFALILAAALQQAGHDRRAAAESATRQERRRLARDLHDGLAQDLAYLAMHGEQMAQVGGADHPVAVAARRALVFSRSEIVDLAAAEQPSASAALKVVADELGVRSGVRIDIETDGVELGTAAREDLVRIAREAIANAIRHGRAKYIVVSLRRLKDEIVLTVQDDGCGIAVTVPNGRTGFGMRAMRQRAATLGGNLATWSGTRGGTVVEVRVP